MISKGIFSSILMIGTLLIANSNSIAQEERCAPIYQEELTLENVAPYGSPEELTEYFPPGTRHIDVFVHIVRYSNGSGGISLSDVNTAMTQLNDAFNSLNTTNITFTLTGTEYIDDDEFASIDDEDEAVDLMLTNVAAAHINVYFVPSLYAAGVAFTPGTSLIVENGYATDGGTLTHEVGHNLYLFHTHETGFGVEHITRQGYPGCPPNCDQAGDLLCDTPADPNLLYHANQSCQYDPIGNPTDPCGNSNYQPNVHNYMSYAPSLCMNHFSSQQINRMHWALATSFWIRELIETDVTMANRVNSNNVSGSTLEVNQTTVPSGSSITLLDGDEYTGKTNHERFEDYPGVGDVKHHDWNSQFLEYLLAENFIVDKSQPDPHRDANFELMETVAIKNNLLSAGGADDGTLNFHDPWYVDENENQPDDFVQWDSPHYPKGKYGETEGGVFLNQGLPNWQPPYYTVRAPQQQTIAFHGYQYITWYFQRWSGTNVSFQNPEQRNTAVVFQQPNAIAQAEYKGHMASNTAKATAYNNSRNLIRDDTGTWHLVYEDNGSIYYTQSEGDEIHIWSPGVLLAQAEGDESYYNPSIALNRYVNVVYERKKPHHTGAYDEYKVVYRRKDRYGGGWETPIICEYFPNADYYTAPSIVADSDVDVWIVWMYYDGIAVRYCEAGQWFLPRHVPDTKYGDRFPSITRVTADYYDNKIVWSRGESDIYFIECNGNSEGWEWSEMENLTEEYGWKNVVGGPCITNRHTNETHIAWHGHSPGYYVSPVFHLDKNSGILTELSAYGYVAEYPSLSARRDYEDLAISYYDPYLHEVYTLLRVDGEWTPPPGIGGYTGQFPTQNPNSSVIHMVYSKWTEPPYFLDSKILFNPEDLNLESQPENMVYYRRGDINLSKMQVNNGDSLFSGILTLEIFPDSSQMRFVKGPNIKNEFLNSFPFTAGLQPLDLRLKLRLNRFQSVQNLPPELLKKEIFELKLVDAQNNSKLHSIKLIRIKDLLNLHQMGDSLDIELSVPTAPFLGREIAVKTNFSNMNLEKAVKWTHVYRTLQTPEAKIALQENTLTPVQQTPTQFQLKQNYPNPFNPTTIIAFDLPQNSFVELEIYDISGRKVRTVVNKNMEAGSHQVVWDGYDEVGNQAASGVYFYRIQAGKFAAVNKMLLMK